jgi:hypothetical protein
MALFEIVPNISATQAPPQLIVGAEDTKRSLELSTDP